MRKYTRMAHIDGHLGSCENFFCHRYSFQAILLVGLSLQLLLCIFLCGNSSSMLCQNTTSPLVILYIPLLIVYQQRMVLDRGARRAKMPRLGFDSHNSGLLLPKNGRYTTAITEAVLLPSSLMKILLQSLLDSLIFFHIQVQKRERWQ